VKILCPALANWRFAIARLVGEKSTEDHLACQFSCAFLHDHLGDMRRRIARQLPRTGFAVRFTGRSAGCGECCNLEFG
jgi:hypothetical protein